MREEAEVEKLKAYGTEKGDREKGRRRRRKSKSRRGYGKRR